MSSLGSNFFLFKPKRKFKSMLEVFLYAKAGVFVLQCDHYQCAPPALEPTLEPTHSSPTPSSGSAEDMEHWDQPGVESIPHYAVYNAGTGVVFTYPEFAIVEPSDRVDAHSLDKFFARLEEAPFLLKFHLHRATFRQVGIFLRPGCEQLPY